MQAVQGQVAPGRAESSASSRDQRGGSSALSPTLPVTLPGVAAGWPELSIAL